MDKYIIQRNIYSVQSGAVQVFAAKRVADEVDVALKIQYYKPTAEVYLSEPLAMKELDHPNILRILDFFFFEDSGSFQSVIVMPLMDGSLSREIESRRTTNSFWQEEEILRVLFDMSSALAYAETCGIAHQDIKPANILIKGTSYVLADFGSSKRLFEERKDTDDLQGTSGYMSPELFNHFMSLLRGVPWHGKYDLYSADVYSLGKAMLEMATLLNPNKASMTEFRHRLLRFPTLSKILPAMVSDSPRDRPTFAYVRDTVEKLIVKQCTICKMPFQDTFWQDPNEQLFCRPGLLSSVCSHRCLLRAISDYTEEGENCVLCGEEVNTEKSERVILRCCHFVCSFDCLLQSLTHAHEYEGGVLVLRCTECRQTADTAYFPNGDAIHLESMLDDPCEKCGRRKATKTLSCGHSCCADCVFFFLREICPICRKA